MSQVKSFTLPFTVLVIVPFILLVGALTMSWYTSTDPEIAHVGLHEADARAGGIPTVVIETKLDRADRAVADGEADGFVKILATSFTPIRRRQRPSTIQPPHTTRHA